MDFPFSKGIHNSYLRYVQPRITGEIVPNPFYNTTSSGWLRPSLRQATMWPDDRRTKGRRVSERWIDLPTAASLLGTTTEGMTKHATRETLRSDKQQDGRALVW